MYSFDEPFKLREDFSCALTLQRTSVQYSQLRQNPSQESSTVSLFIQKLHGPAFFLGDLLPQTGNAADSSAEIKAAASSRKLTLLFFTVHTPAEIRGHLRDQFEQRAVSCRFSGGVRF